MRRCEAIALVLGLTLGATIQGDAWAQDAHYWNNQYGTSADLLGGVVVGGTQDLSTTYYNPGGLAMMDKPGLLLSTEAFELTTITVEDGTGEGVDLGTTSTNKAPSLFAIQFTFPWLGENKLAFSSLTRYRFNVGVDARKIAVLDALPDVPGKESFSGEILLGEKLTETWGGITWARRAGSHVGYGITTYMALRSQSSRFQTIGEAVTGDGSRGSAAIAIRDFSFWNLRALMKIGLVTHFDPLLLGVSVTTPSLDLFGSGSSFINVAGIDLDLDGNGIPESNLVSNQQENLPARYRSPLSIALGLEYQFGPTSVHAGAEWFDAVGAFDFLEAESFTAQTTGVTVQPNVVHELRSITNYGIGIEHTIHEDLSIYASFTTDFSALNRNSNTILAVADWDIYHLTAGSVFTIRNLAFALGVGYAFGDEPVERLIDFRDASSANQLLGSQGERRVRYARWKLLIGLEVPI